jgi:peptide/nickel transport system substrate-binding protein
MKNKLFAILSLLVISSVALASCGSKPPVVIEGLQEKKFEPVTLSAADCEYGGEFKSVEAVDELTVKFTLCYPDPAFLYKISLTSFGIQPKEWLEFTKGGGVDSQLLTQPIGTGPYYVAQWKRGEELILTAYANYWGDKAKTPTVVFRWSSESAQRLLELQAGTVDAIDNVGPDDFDTVEGDSNLALLKRPALNIAYIGMNNTYAPFDNELVRQAIAMGIDRARLVKNFYPAGSEVADYFTPCAITNGCVGEKWTEFDPVAAKALLAQAGYPDGFETEIAFRDVVRGYLPQPSVVAQDIQAQLKANLNIDAKIVIMESGAFLDAADKGELKGLHLLGWGADYPDQTNFLDVHFGPGASDQFGTKWDDIIAALRQAASLADPAARKPYYEQVNALLKQHVPMIPLAHGGSAMAWLATAEGANVSPLTMERFAGVAIPGKDTFVFMQNAEPISLYCADESDGESLRACDQVTEPLYTIKTGTTEIEPGVATVCTPNDDLTVWTCTLRKNVKFHNGFKLDAGDVVATFGAQWDASDPLHVGNTGEFYYFSALFAGFMNVP